MKEVFAHRGDTVNHVENTYNSIIEIDKISSNELNIGIEFDIQLTNDDKLICFHDKNMKRLFNKDIVIEEMNTTDIKIKDICYLNDILNYYKDNKNIILNIEVKCFNLNKLKKKRLCNKIIDLVKKYECNFIISSFNREIVNYLYKNKNNFLVGYIIDNFDNNEYNKIKNNIDYLICNKSIDKNIILEISKNKKILIFTLYNKKNQNIKYDEYLIKYFYENKNIGFITDNIYKFI